MTAVKPRKKPVLKVESHEASSTLIGLAFAMPDMAAAAMSSAEEAPIDFQAKQDSIAETRRNPGAKLAPKLKQTTAEPAKAKETKFKL